MKIGILKTPPQSTPVVAFQVLAGLQRHPVWAIDRLAAVVYCTARLFGSTPNPAMAAS